MRLRSLPPCALLVAACAAPTPAGAGRAVPAVSVPPASTSSLPPEPSGAPAPGPAAPFTLAFEHRELPEGPYGTPRAQYGVVGTDGAGHATRVDLGAVDGACYDMEPEGSSSSGETWRVLHCWWAGMGDDFAIVRRGADAVVLHTVLSEESPPSPPREVGRIHLPPGANVQWRAPQEGEDGASR